VTVYLMPQDAWGCGYYRMVWPGNAALQSGYAVRVYDPGGTGPPIDGIRLPDGSIDLRSVWLPGDAECIVLQRPATQVYVRLTEMARQAGVAVIVDMDDDMSSLHTRNVAFSSYNRTNTKGSSWQWCAEVCKRATMVTTSTKRLQTIYAKHGRGRVLDNYVPPEYLAHSPAGTGRFGWPGVTSTHPDDLQVTGRAVHQLQAEGFEFGVVGGPSKVKDTLRLTQDFYASPVVETLDWAPMIAETLSVGMAPLARSSFNRAKSRLKPIELMSIGVPVVMSPSEEYRRLYRESGVGLLADTPKDWYTQLKRLLTDDVLYKEQAEAGKAYMQDQTYDKQCWRWCEAWDDAIKLEKSLR
jgi:glycosyl transferase family 1